MYRFVDLNDAYWTNPDGSEDAQCAILDTRTNRFLECDGQHVLGSMDEVHEAAGERGAGLVPAGFFERRQRGWAPVTGDNLTTRTVQVNGDLPPLGTEDEPDSEREVVVLLDGEPRLMRGHVRAGIRIPND
jgi:hypothetical protein